MLLSDTTRAQVADLLPRGVRLHALGAYRLKDIAEPERLVYTHGDDSEGKGREFQTTVTFEEQQGKTLLTMRAVFATAAERDRYR